MMVMLNTNENHFRKIVYAVVLVDSQAVAGVEDCDDIEMITTDVLAYYDTNTDGAINPEDAIDAVESSPTEGIISEEVVSHSEGATIAIDVSRSEDAIAEDAPRSEGDVIRYLAFSGPHLVTRYPG